MLGRSGTAGRSTWSARICIAICAIMLAPLVLTVLASFKSTIEQAAIPPTYFTHRAQPRQLCEALELPGRPAGLSLQQRRDGGPRDRLQPRADDSRRLRAGALPDAGEGVLLHLPAPRADHPLSGADHAALLHVRDAEADQHAVRPRHHPHRDPHPLQPLHHAQQLRGGAERTGGSGGDRRLQQLAGADDASICRRSGRRS